MVVPESPATCSGATLAMIDEWFDPLLDEPERPGILDETLLVYTADHGLLVGERGLTGKNKWPVSNEPARTL